MRCVFGRMLIWSFSRMSRVTTFADIFQAKQYVGYTTSNTFAAPNSILTVTGNTGFATFVDIVSTLSSAGYSPGIDPSTLQLISTTAADVTSLSTGLSTVNAYQDSLIEALYQVVSTSFSTITGEFTQLSTPSTLVYYSDYSTLRADVDSMSNVVGPRISHQPVCRGDVVGAAGVSDQPVQFTSTITNGWNWYPTGDTGGQISSIYCSTAGIYEVTANINYGTVDTNGGLILQLRNGSGSVLDETLDQLPAAGSVVGAGSIRFVSLQPIAAGGTVQLHLSTTTVPHTVSLVSGQVGAKLIWDSNVPALY
jgi:hypothetical protein